MKILPRSHVIYTFCSSHSPAYKVQDGEEFWVEMDDCYGVQVIDASVKRPDIDPSRIDGSVGPICIAGAHPGETLRVDLLAIELADHGIMMTGKGLGVLGDRITEPDTKIIPIRDGEAWFSPTIRLPLTPMLGVCGVAPAPGLDIHCATPGDHGANLDTTKIRAGSSIYLPIFIPGAGLAVGDLHACMGDGELSGTGLEIAGRVHLRTTILPRLSIRRPVVETKEALYLLASAGDLNSAIKLASTDATEFLQHCLSLEFPDAYRLLSALCDLQICQVVNPLYTVRIRIPKFSPAISLF